MKEDTLVVHEIYRSIQGESTFAGLPCTFVRLTGCNLRCTWCDTPQAFYKGTRLARAEVLRRARLAVYPEACLDDIPGVFHPWLVSGTGAQEGNVRVRAALLDRFHRARARVRAAFDRHLPP